MATSSGNANPDGAIDKSCTPISYGSYGTPGIGSFVISFALFYVCLPMFLNKDINPWVFGIILFYYILDVSVKSMKGCLSADPNQQAKVVLINTISGAAFGTLFPALLYVGGSSKYLFFNELSSTKEICSMPKSQQFKCSVYKNGELVGTN